MTSQELVNLDVPVGLNWNEHSSLSATTVILVVCWARLSCGLAVALMKLNIAVRGLYGEGTEALGNFFQISNQVSLGHSEAEIIENINGLIGQIIDQENQARNLLNTRNKAVLEDRVYRSFGILKSAHIITSQETTELLSMVRLGCDLGMLKDINRSHLNELFIITQPAHLQKLENKRLSSAERDIKRAEIIRSKLKI